MTRGAFLSITRMNRGERRPHLVINFFCRLGALHPTEQPSKRGVPIEYDPAKVEIGILPYTYAGLEFKIRVPARQGKGRVLANGLAIREIRTARSL
jgi:hypothetical protein